MHMHGQVCEHENREFNEMICTELKLFAFSMVLLVIFGLLI